jgi:hypothetical protein
MNRRNELQISVEGEALARTWIGFYRIRCNDPRSFAHSLQASGIGVLDPESLTLRAFEGVDND